VGILELWFGGGPEDSVYSVAVSTNGITIFDSVLLESSAKGGRLRRARRLSRFIPWAEVAAVEPVRADGMPRTIRIRRPDGTVCQLSKYHFDFRLNPKRRAADVGHKCELLREALRASRRMLDESDGGSGERL
jgi:hypothetical protein